MWLQFKHKWTDKMSPRKKHIYVTVHQVLWEAGVQAHPQKFWFVENPSKIAENLGKIGGQCCLISKMAPNSSRKTHEDLFWMSYQKRSSWFLIFVEKFCRENPQNVSGKFGKFRAKILRNPKNLLLLHLCTSTDFQIKSGWCLNTRETESHFE